MLEWMTEEIKKEVSQNMKNAMQSVSKKAVPEVKKIRSDIINAWFDGFRGMDFSAFSNNVVKVSMHFTGDLSGEIEINSWTESSTLPNHKSAERWRRKHGGEQSSNEYVADLVFDEGIIGLPEYSTIPNFTQYSNAGNAIWLNGHNEHFHKKTPLSEVIDLGGENGESLWDIYQDKVEKDFLNKMNQ